MDFTIHLVGTVLVGRYKVARCLELPDLWSAGPVTVDAERQNAEKTNSSGDGSGESSQEKRRSRT